MSFAFKAHYIHPLLNLDSQVCSSTIKASSPSPAKGDSGVTDIRHRCRLQASDGEEAALD